MYRSELPCFYCGYDLIGTNPDSRCPECGLPYCCVPQDSHSDDHPRRRGGVVFLLILVHAWIGFLAAGGGRILEWLAPPSDLFGSQVIIAPAPTVDY
jgi:hypothetical protein